MFVSNLIWGCFSVKILENIDFSSFHINLYGWQLEIRDLLPTINFARGNYRQWATLWLIIFGYEQAVEYTATRF